MHATVRHRGSAAFLASSSEGAGFAGALAPPPPPPRTRLLATLARPSTAARELELYLQNAERQNRRRPLGSLAANENYNALANANAGGCAAACVLPAPALMAAPKSIDAPPLTWNQVKHKYAALINPPLPPLPPPPPPVHLSSLGEDPDGGGSVAAQLDRYEALLRECAAECQLAPPPPLTGSSRPPASARAHAAPRPFPGDLDSLSSGGGTPTSEQQQQQQQQQQQPSNDSATTSKARAEPELGIDKAAAMRRKMAAMRSRSRASSSPGAPGSGDATRQDAPRTKALRPVVRFSEELDEL